MEQPRWVAEPDFDPAPLRSKPSRSQPMPETECVTASSSTSPIYKYTETFGQMTAGQCRIFILKPAAAKYVSRPMHKPWHKIELRLQTSKSRLCRYGEIVRPCGFGRWRCVKQPAHQSEAIPRNPRHPPVWTNLASSCSLHAEFGIAKAESQLDASAFHLRAGQLFLASLSIGCIPDRAARKNVVLSKRDSVKSIAPQLVCTF